MDNMDKRHKDTMQIFEDQWQAKNSIKNIPKKKQDFRFKMYGIKEPEDIRNEIRKSNTVSAKVEKLNQKIEGLKNFNRNNW